MTDISRNLKTRMKAKKITAKKLAERANVPLSTLKDWSTGGSVRDLQALKRVASELEIGFEALIFGEEQNPTVRETINSLPTKKMFSGWAKISIEVLDEDGFTEKD